MALCEDYPCCGHTSQDPCEPQWYDDQAAVYEAVRRAIVYGDEYGDYDF